MGLPSASTSALPSASTRLPSASTPAIPPSPEMSPAAPSMPAPAAAPPTPPAVAASEPSEISVASSPPAEPELSIAWVAASPAPLARPWRMVPPPSAPEETCESVSLLTRRVRASSTAPIIEERNFTAMKVMKMMPAVVISVMTSTVVTGDFMPSARMPVAAAPAAAIDSLLSRPFMKICSNMPGSTIMNSWTILYRNSVPRISMNRAAVWTTTLAIAGSRPIVANGIDVSRLNARLIEPMSSAMA